jgi:DNA-binding response OmpR family regulator
MDSAITSHSPPTVLTISRDAPLQETRTLMLEKEGYTVIALGFDEEVHRFLGQQQQPHLDLALMCHSVPEASRITLCDALKLRHPETPILMLYNGYDPTAAKVDGRLENMHSPPAFVQTIRLLIGHTMKPHGDLA